MTRARKGKITVALNTLAGKVIDENSLIDGGFIRYNSTNNNFVYFNLINNLSEGYLPVFSSNTFVNSPVYVSGSNVGVTTPLFLEKTLKLSTSYIPTALEVPGESYWDQDNMTYSDVLLNGVIGQRYQEDFVIIKNTSGIIIPNGAPVMYSGVVGASGKLTGRLAIADDTYPSVFMLGIATQQIAINAWGYITVRGNVRNLDTTGTPYGETWQEGDIIYVSATSPGYLTKFEPQAPNLTIFAAVVATKHSSNGTLYVRPTWTPKLTELADVDGTPLTTSGQMLVWHQDTRVFDFDKNINDYFLASAMEDTKNLTGWLDGDNINVSYNFTNRTVTITHPSGNLYYSWRGIKRELGIAGTWTSTPHATTIGGWFLASDDGISVIWKLNTPWLFEDLMVAYVNYGGTALTSFCIRETHGTMDYEAHEEFHTQIGTYRKSGGQVTAGTYAFNTATDAANSPGFEAFVLKDEDVLSSEPVWLQGTYTTMYVGPSGSSVFNTTNSLPFIASGANNFIQLNNVTTGAMSPGIHNNYYNVYQILMPCASDVDSQKFRIIMLQPQRAYTSLAAAQAEDVRILSLGQLALLSPEFVFYTRITYLAQNADTNYGKCIIPTNGISYIIGNKIGQISVSGLAGTDHAALTNLGWTTSGHTGTENTLASFGGIGETTHTLLSTLVQTSGDQTVAGVKTFNSSPIVPTPVSTTHAANKSYVDTKVNANITITGATKTKITYDSKGLVTFGSDAGISDITGLQTALDNKVSLTGGTGYIQNQNASAQTANMWISGNVTSNINNSLQYNLNGANINTPNTLTNVAYKGTLTTNYLTKYNGTQLVNANVFDDGTSVGISTATPLSYSNMNIGSTTGKFIIGTTTVGNASVFASKVNVEGGTGSGYASYWAMDAYFDETTSTWLPLRTTLGGKYKIEQSYHKGGILFSYAAAVQSPITWVDAMIINNLGNVGIGTTTPTHRLHVTTSNNTYSGLFLNVNGTQDGHGLYVQTRWNVAENYVARFTTNSGTNEVMALKGNGNVGIGTTEPLSKLHISGSTGLSVNNIYAGNAYGLVTIGDVGTGGSLFVNTQSINSNVYPSGLGIDGTYSGVTSVVNLKAFGINEAGYGSNLAFSTTTGATVNEAMRILNNGNVGIGTTAPTVRLSVTGQTYLGAEPTSGIAWLPSIGSPNAIINTNIVPNINTGSVLGLSGRYRTSDNGAVAFASIAGLKENATNANLDGYLAIFTSKTSESGSNERMRITSSGNVGIGTTSPSEKLDVNGNARIRSVGTGTLSQLVGITSDGTFTTATDGSITHEKIANSLKQSATVTGSINLSANAIGKITLSSNTAFSFSNYQMNKNYLLIITANGFTASFADPSKHIFIEGNVPFETTGVFYVSITCIDNTVGSEKLLTTIMQEAI